MLLPRCSWHVYCHPGFPSPELGVSTHAYEFLALLVEIELVFHSVQQRDGRIATQHQR